MNKQKEALKLVKEFLEGLPEEQMTFSIADGESSTTTIGKSYVLEKVKEALEC